LSATLFPTPSAAGATRRTAAPGWPRGHTSAYLFPAVSHQPRSREIGATGTLWLSSSASIQEFTVANGSVTCASPRMRFGRAGALRSRAINAAVHAAQVTAVAGAC